MQDDVMQSQIQPFVKLAQSNMDLLTRFSTSPEMTSEANANVNQLFKLVSESSMNLMQSGAFANMIQGMLKNYTEFLTELSQSSVEMMSQGQAAMTRQVEESTKDVVDAAASRGGRVRQAA